MSFMKLKAERERCEGLAEEPPATLAEALELDLREARGRWDGLYEEIGATCGVKAKTVYSWHERAHVWKDEEIRAVVKTTGGRWTRALLERLGAAAPGEAIEQGDVPCRLAEILEQVARVNGQVVRDLAPGDDTPGELDRRELRLARAQVASAIAALTSLQGSLEEMERAVLAAEARERAAAKSNGRRGR
jgi:hypothetical protein